MTKSLEVQKKSLQVKVRVCNTGGREGTEAVQANIGKGKSRVGRLRRLLKGFEKIELGAGEQCIVNLQVKRNELMYFDAAAGQWVLEPGKYAVYAGPSLDGSELLRQEIDIG